MKVLITGSSGFIGKNIKNELVKLNINHVELIRNPKNQKEFNILNDQQISKAFIDVDIVIHCAGISSSPENNKSENWDDYNLANIKLTEKIANEAMRNKIKRFIFLSSAKVFGENSFNGSFKPESLPNPKNYYSKSKLFAENNLKKICNTSTMDYVILRPPMVYGKDMNSNFSKLFDLAKKGFPLPFGLLNKKRSSVYIKNLIDLIIHVIKENRFKNKTILVSDDDDLSVKQMVKTIYKIYGKKSIVFPIPRSFFKALGKFVNKAEAINSLTESFLVDITSSKNLDWKPKYNFEIAVEDMKNDNY